MLLAQIQEKQEQEKVLTEEWTEKWRETQQILQEQKALGLRKSGVGVVLDSEMPHLVGIDDDLLSTGVTLYHLKEGKTLVGTEEASVVQVTNIIKISSYTYIKQKLHIANVQTIDHANDAQTITPIQIKDQTLNKNF